MAGSADRLFRPRDLALMLLASGDLLPRQRARDQQADIAGNSITRRVLERLTVLDPEPQQLAACLDAIVQELGDPSGPTRAVARNIAEEFETIGHSPELLGWLIERAANRPAEKPSHQNTNLR